MGMDHSQRAIGEHEMKTKPHGLKGRPSNATKKLAEKKDTNLIVRCKTLEYALWAKTAESSGLTLSGWVTKILNRASEKPLETLKTYRDLENLSRP